jgi:putative ABC transport system substrate-binding protein
MKLAARSALPRSGVCFWVVGGIGLVLSLLGTVPLHANAQQIVVLTSAEADPYRLALRGFQEALSQKQQRAGIHQYVLKDGSDRERLLAEIRQRQPSLILTLGSAATALAQTDLKDTPVVFCMVLNPQAGGFVQSMQSSGNNLTGASLDVPVRVQFEALQLLIPSVKRIGVFYNPAETDKIIQPAVKIAASMGLELIPIVVSAPEQLQVLGDTLRSRNLDALWSVADSTVFASSRSVEFLLRRTLDARIPFMGLSSEFVKAGALIALSVDYKDIGFQCGEQAVQVLRGSAPSSLPITVPRKVTLHINLNFARALGLPVPPQVLEKAVVYGSRVQLPPSY